MAETRGIEETKDILDFMFSFVEAGGKAKWKFIVFKHNRHQQDEARKLSQQLGFADFEIQDHGRNYGPVLNREGKITHWILPADDSMQPTPYDVPAGIDRYKKTHENFIPEVKIYQISCEHETESTVYIDARGRIGPCCYQGFDLPGLPFVEIKDFPILKDSWQTKKCNFVCAMSCGK